MPLENVSDQEAIEVKYYGVRGWLKFFFTCKRTLSMQGFNSGYSLTPSRVLTGVAVGVSGGSVGSGVGVWAATRLK